MNNNLRWLFLLMAVAWGFVVFLAFAAGLRAETVGLAWDANPPEDRVEFYTVYVNGQGVLDVPETEAWLDVEGCAEFFVTASRGELESGPSNTVAYCPETPQEPQEPPQEPQEPPQEPSGNKSGGCFITTIGG